MKKLLFLGNDGNLILDILKLKNIRLSGVVADRVYGAQRRYFGSAYCIARKLKIAVILQKEFQRNPKSSLSGIFGRPDIIFIQGYSYKINKDLVDDKGMKIINFHQSILPAYGGRHPLNWAIIRGEKESGITFHYVNDNFDEGDIILQKKVIIAKCDDVISLYSKTIECAKKNLGRALRLAYDSSYAPKKQDLQNKIYLPPRRPEDGEISRSDSIRQVADKVRALVFPYPGAFICFNKRKIIIDGVKKIRDSKAYANVEFAAKGKGGIILRCRDGLLKVTKMRK